MKKIALLICTILLSANSIEAQSLKDLFSKKGASRIASSVGVAVPLKIEGTWKYGGTAIELKTDNALKKAAAEVAAIAAEEKINEQLSNLGFNTNTIKFNFKEDGVMSISALERSLPGKYTLSEDKKHIKIELTKMLNFEADVKSAGNTMSLLFEADKLMQLIEFIASKSNYASIQAINKIASGYDGIKIGFQLEKEG